MMEHSVCVRNLTRKFGDFTAVDSIRASSTLKITCNTKVQMMQSNWSPANVFGCVKSATRVAFGLLWS